MKLKIAINSKTTGKFEKRFLNNREHLVTSMVTIVGNSVMNKGFYPLEEVQNTFEQLHFLPAPNGHPKVGNELVSAFHPLAVNAFNIGGMVRNPKMEGNNVVNEFWLDLEIANQSDDGIELISRIENGEEVGVSTGLSVQQEITNGQQDGVDYNWVARQINYDHVAILLNEKAAGAHVGTKLQTNTSNVDIVNCAVLADSSAPVADEQPPVIKSNILDQLVNSLKDVFVTKDVENAITTDSLEHQLRNKGKEIWPDETFWSWVTSVFPTINTVIFEVETRMDNVIKLIQCTYSVDANDQVSLNDDKIQVVRKVEFVEVDGDVNIFNSNPEEDNDMAKENKPGEKDVTNGDKLTVENAINLLEDKGFRVNTKEEAEKLEFFTKNQAKFESIINAEEDELEGLRKDLVTNSDLTEDDVKDMGKDMLVKLGNSFNPPQNYTANAGGSNNLRVVNSDISDDDYEDDYTSITEPKGDE